MGMFRVDDYVCKDCNHKEELLLAKDEKPKCSNCGSENVERVIAISVGNNKHGSWSRW